MSGCRRLPSSAIVDPRFFRTAGPFALGALAALAEARLTGGDPDALIADVAPLDRAGGNQITFLDNPKYLAQAAATRAAACLVRPEHADRLPASVARLLTAEPYHAYARIAAALHPELAAPSPDHPPAAGLAPGAIVDSSATVHPSCQVAAGAVIEAGVEIGARCRIGANAVIGAGVRLGPDCVIGPGTSLSHCLLGARVVVHAGARVGQDGFGFALGRNGHLKVPQLGRVLIGDDVEIGANSTIDRGSGPDTVIGRGCKIDNLVMIAHNVRLGDGCVVVAQSGISGSTTIGAGSVLAAQVGITGHLTIGPGVQLAARSAVIRDLPGGETYGGAPAIPARQWRRQMAAIGRLGRRKVAKDE
jgi:UDP-3-O-[3-hydroxymyristoyl] glucosamine N-acyltransferase